MKRSTLLMSAALMAFGAASALAQTPNFAGTWTLEPDAAAAAAAGGGRGGGRGGGGMMALAGIGQQATIAQDAETITITQTTPQGEIKSVYKLDGSDSKNTLSLGNMSIERTGKAKWEGSKLVIANTMEFNGNPIESTMTMSLDGSGNLVVETTGGMGRGGAAAPRTFTYKKS